MNPALLETYTSFQAGDQWNDLVAVFVKDEQAAALYPRRIVHVKPDLSNGWIFGGKEPIKPSVLPEDRRKLVVIKQIIDNVTKVI